MASTEEVRLVSAGRQDGMVGNVWSAKGLGEN